MKTREAGSSTDDVKWFHFRGHVHFRGVFFMNIPAYQNCGKIRITS